MKRKIKQLIKDFVERYQARRDIRTTWREPAVAFADAEDQLFAGLKEAVSPSHYLPGDFLKDAATVITYFLPFTEQIVQDNIIGRGSAETWAIAYIETNRLIGELNCYLQQELEKEAYHTVTIPATHNFDQDSLRSDWSHRHVAYIAGLGNFGLNNMLITEHGCCGRLGSLITDLRFEPTPRPDREYCLYKEKGVCRKCLTRCVTTALKTDSFDRRRCYALCLENADHYRDLGLADVCGKCLVNLPCSLRNPVKV